MKRSHLQIINDILRVIQANGPCRPTHIVYKANLSHERFKNYMRIIIERELVEQVTIKKITHYAITAKGTEFMQNYRRFSEMADAFGLPL